jgi:hypothetical protein
MCETHVKSIMRKTRQLSMDTTATGRTNEWKELSNAVRPRDLVREAVGEGGSGVGGV